MHFLEIIFAEKIFQKLCKLSKILVDLDQEIVESF